MGRVTVLISEASVIGLVNEVNDILASTPPRLSPAPDAHADKLAWLPLLPHLPSKLNQAEQTASAQHQKVNLLIFEPQSSVVLLV